MMLSRCGDLHFSITFITALFQYIETGEMLHECFQASPLSSAPIGPAPHHVVG